MSHKKLNVKSIEDATKRVKERMPLEKMRRIPKYKDITEEQYHKLIKDTETFALLILQVFAQLEKTTKDK